MTTISVMIGGCGNYLGLELFDAIHRELQRAVANEDHDTSQNLRSRFFIGGCRSSEGGSLRARSLLIDMEAKVVQNCLLRRPGNPVEGTQMFPPQRSTSCLQMNSTWCFDPNFAFWKQGGCGNNWALGHEVEGPSHRQTLERMILDISEESDVVDSVLLLHSVAGESRQWYGPGCKAVWKCSRFIVVVTELHSLTEAGLMQNTDCSFFRYRGDGIRSGSLLDRAVRRPVAQKMHCKLLCMAI